MEGLGGFPDHAARGIRRLQLFERRVQTDGLEVEQGHTLEAGDGGVDVSRHAQVDDELTMCADGAARRGGAGRQLQVLGAEHGLRRRGAGDEQARPRGGAGVLVGGDRTDAVLRGEDLGAAGRRVHRDVHGTAFAERGEGDRGVGTGADQQHAFGGPVGDAAVCQLERETHERAAGATEGRDVLDLALGLAGALEEALELGRSGAVFAGGLESAAHLPCDLALAGDDGFETGGDGEEVLGDAAPRVHGVGAVEVGGRDAGRGFDRFDHGFDTDGAGGGDRFVHFHVRLEPVARRQHDRTLHARRHAHDGGSDVVGGAAQAFEQFEGGGLVTRRHTQQHTSIVPEGLRGRIRPVDSAAP